jgi:hypothetical protein
MRDFHKASTGWVRLLECENLPLNQAVHALGGFSIDEGGIFPIFLIHSAALCSASSSCSMGMGWLRWFLAWVMFAGDEEPHSQ